MMDLTAQMEAFTAYLRQIEGPLEPGEREALHGLYLQLVALLAEERHRGGGDVQGLRPPG